MTELIDKGNFGFGTAGPDADVLFRRRGEGAVFENSAPLRRSAVEQ